MSQLIIVNKLYSKKEKYISIIVPILIVLFAQTHLFLLLGLAIFLSLTVVKNPYVLFPTVFLTSLNTNYFAIIEGLSCGLIYSSLFIISLVIKGVAPKSNRSKRLLAWTFVLILFNFFESITSITGSMSYFVIMLENLLIVFLLSNQININVQEVSRSLSITSIISVFLMSLSFFSGQMIESEVGRYTIEGVNENRMAMTYAQLSIVIFFSFFSSRNTIYRIISLASFFFALFLLLLSGSRSALFGVIIGCFIILICAEFISGNSKKKILPLIFLGIIMFIGINYLIDLDLPVFERFKLENIIEGKGTHRIERRDFLMTNVFPEHPLLGVGLGGDNEYAISPGPCHNIFYDPLIQIGIIGIVLYWFYIFSILWIIPKLVRHKLEIVLPMSLLIACLVNGMGEVIFFEKFFWNAIALCGLYSNSFSKMHISLKNKTKLKYI